MNTIGEIVEIYKGSKAENVFNGKRPKALPYLQIEDLRPNSKKKYTDDSNGFVVNEKTFWLLGTERTQEQLVSDLTVISEAPSRH